MLAAGLLMLISFGDLPDATAAINENGNEIISQRLATARHARVRHVRRHHRHGKTQVTYTNGTITETEDDPIAVPEGGSTLAMMAASTALLLLGYRRLKHKRVAA